MRNENVTNRLFELIELGKKVVASKAPPPRNVARPASVKAELFFHWKAASLSYLKMVFGEESTHYELFSRNCKDNVYSEAVEGYGILIAAKEDIEQGFLGNLQILIAADVFSDFLEMAGHLLECGYKDPAASLLGAVLEDGLRKICEKETVAFKPKDDINSLNQKLADAGVYNRIVQKKVKVWEDIRNKADHAEFDEYTTSLVEEMRNGITQFLADFI
jgi:hypothetical protein